MHTQTLNICFAVVSITAARARASWGSVWNPLPYFIHKYFMNTLVVCAVMFLPSMIVFSKTVIFNSVLFCHSLRSLWAVG